MVRDVGVLWADVSRPQLFVRTVSLPLNLSGATRWDQPTWFGSQISVRIWPFGLSRCQGEPKLPAGQSVTGRIAMKIPRNYVKRVFLTGDQHCRLNAMANGIQSKTPTVCRRSMSITGMNSQNLQENSTRCGCGCWVRRFTSVSEAWRSAASPAIVMAERRFRHGMATSAGRCDPFKMQSPAQFFRWKHIMPAAASRNSKFMHALFYVPRRRSGD